MGLLPGCLEENIITFHMHFVGGKINQNKPISMQKIAPSQVYFDISFVLKSVLIVLYKIKKPSWVAQVKLSAGVQTVVVPSLV